MFANKFTNGCILLAFVCQTPAALAQKGSTEQPKRFYRPVPPLPPELGFAYHHASTAAEGWLRGQAAVVHATGNYWFSFAQALICREETRCLALANRRRWVEYRIAMRDWHERDRQRRIAERRSKNEALRPTSYEVYRLKPNQLDRMTGVISWPEVLRAAEYDDLRGRLDELFRNEANCDGSYGTSAAEVSQYVKTLMDEVRRNRNGMTPAEYLAAERFLCGVKHEAEFPLIGEGLDDQRNTASAQPAGQSKTLTVIK